MLWLMQQILCSKYVQLVYLDFILAALIAQLGSRYSLCLFGTCWWLVIGMASRHLVSHCIAVWGLAMLQWHSAFIIDCQCWLHALDTGM